MNPRRALPAPALFLLWIAGGFLVNPAAAQSPVPDGAAPDPVASGFRFVEGPLWREDGALLFSDIPANTIYRWTPDDSVEVFRRPSGHANGLALDASGRLLLAQHDRRVSRLEDGREVPLATHYQGQRLNSPNDLVVAPDGAIYFTDPPYGIKPEQEELGFYGVYRLAPDGSLRLLADDFVRPNGLALAPDGSRLYVNDSEKRHIRVFDVAEDGTLANGRLFAELKDATARGVPDGMEVDAAGRVYSTGPGGVWIFDPDGTLLDRIAVPARQTTNLAWGDADRRTLYITGGDTVYRIRLNAPGVQ